MPPKNSKKSDSNKKTKQKDDIEESVSKLKISKDKKKRNSNEMDVEDETATDGKQEVEQDAKPEPFAGRQTRSVASALQSPNYLFYTNQMKSTPHGDFIDQIHKNWYGNYDLLEDHHGYIQWLFPVFESGGMNSKSEALSKAEAKLIRENEECAKRVIQSYRLMLNFYGMRLVDEDTGEIERDPENWRDRYRNLSTNSHNFLRISRIIISLGELGFRRYKQPFVDHFIKEIKKNEVLKACKRSLDDFWIPLLDEKSAAYIKKTRENPEDRTESVYFKNK